MKIPVVIQNHSGENAASALAMMMAYYKKYVPMEQILNVCVFSRSGTSPKQMCEAAEYFGLDAEIRQVDSEALRQKSCPFAAQWKKRYFVIVKKIKNDKVLLADPAKGEYAMTLEKFKSLYTGTAIFLKPGKNFTADGKKTTLRSLLRKRFLGYEKAIGITLLLNVLTTGMSMVMLTLTKHMMDDVMSGFYPERYMPILAAMSVGLILGSVFSVLSLFYINHTSRQMAANSGAHLFKRLFRQPLSFFEQHAAGELMERVEGNIRLDHSLLQRFFPRIVDGITLVLYLFLMFSYEKRLALICMVIEAVYILLSIWLQDKISLAARSVSASSGAVNASMLNGLGTIETIKTTGSERKFFSMWYKAQKQYQKNRSAVSGWGTVSSLLTTVHSVLTSAVLLAAGAYFIIEGDFTLGMLSAFQSILTNARTALGNCISTVNSLQTMRTNMERVEDIINRPVREEIFLDPSVEPDKLSGAVKVEHVSYQYAKGDPFAVEDVSFEVKPGQMVALVGETGCGKSTLLKVIADMYEPCAGRILYDGLERREISDVVFHSSVATVDQETVVFEDLISANLKMWDNTVEDYEMILAARDAQIHDRIMMDKNKYSGMIRENGKNFSGGELQRMELARALSQEPTLLLLDEFTSALDARTEEKVFQCIRDKGTTCVIVAHRLSTIVECDHIIVLKKGKIIQQGTHEELYQADGLYRSLVSMQ